jgi:hypothetical protein
MGVFVEQRAQVAAHARIPDRKIVASPVWHEAGSSGIA